jgi:carbonic anhydrase
VEFHALFLPSSLIILTDCSHQRGDYSFSTGQIKPQILSNKLRLLFDRRPCPEVDSPNCTEPDPPQADFPNNWGGSTDLIHVDFKIPSEHLLYGERFDAEMQVVHLHPSRRRTPTRVSLMRASHTGYNPVLQIVIDRFQYLFDDHAAQCASRTRHARNLMTETHKLLGEGVVSPIDFESWGDFSTAHDAPLDHSSRKLQNTIFSPHDEMLIPSIYFYGYQGSLTEPPCSEFVTWFVSDVPMQMSFLQLQQLKRIQFDYVDPNCNRTSVHFQGSNARPIQDTFGRAVWHCTPANFVADPPEVLNNFI